MNKKPLCGRKVFETRLGRTRSPPLVLSQGGGDPKNACVRVARANVILQCCIPICVAHCFQRMGIKYECLVSLSTVTPEISHPRRATTIPMILK